MISFLNNIKFPIINIKSTNIFIFVFFFLIFLCYNKNINSFNMQILLKFNKNLVPLTTNKHNSIDITFVLSILKSKVLIFQCYVLNLISFKKRKKQQIILKCNFFFFYKKKGNGLHLWCWWETHHFDF